MFRPLAIFNRNNAETAPASDWVADPLFRLQHEMNRLFDDAFSGFRLPADFAPDGGAEIRAPRLDVHETERTLEIEAELPGVDEKDIDVQLSDRVLTIRGEKRTEHKRDKEGDYRLIERSFGSFARSSSLPYVVDPDGVEASFRDGVLKLSLPKPPEATKKTVRIAVKRG